jgi:hypothetical protein
VCCAWHDAQSFSLPQIHGKTFKNKHEVAQGQALLQGQGVENAAKIAETVKRQEHS